MRQRTSDLFNNRAGDAERIRLERDRYRKALEEIAAANCVICTVVPALGKCTHAIAREALAPEGE